MCYLFSSIVLLWFYAPSILFNCHAMHYEWAWRVHRLTMLTENFLHLSFKLLSLKVPPEDLKPVVARQ